MDLGIGLPGWISRRLRAVWALDEYRRLNNSKRVCGVIIVLLCRDHRGKLLQSIPIPIVVLRIHFLQAGGSGDLGTKQLEQQCFFEAQKQ